MAFEAKIKEEEKKFTDPDDFSGVPLNELVEYVISTNLSEVNTLEELANMTKILKVVANRMIKVDAALMVAEDNEVSDLRKLKLHPNFISRFD